MYVVRYQMLQHTCWNNVFHMYPFCTRNNLNILHVVFPYTVNPKRTTHYFFLQEIDYYDNSINDLSSQKTRKLKYLNYLYKKINFIKIHFLKFTLDLNID